MSNLSSISSMTPTDLNTIAPILKEDFDDFWSESIFESELQNPNSYYFVSKIDDIIVGFAGIWISMDEAHITNIVTRKSHRKTGIATKLLEKLIQKAKELSLASITLEVNENNFAAQSLYKYFHFKELGKRKKYYHSTCEDAIIMTLFLG